MIDAFLFPRKIAVTRPGAQDGVGAQDEYGGDLKATETPVISDVQCSIQMRREGRQSTTKLPGDTTDPIWWVFIPLEANVPNGTIKAKDIITDDLGVRYTTVAPYWDSLGWRLSTMTLEA